VNSKEGKSPIRELSFIHHPLRFTNHPSPKYAAQVWCLWDEVTQLVAPIGLRSWLQSMLALSRLQSCKASDFHRGLRMSRNPIEVGIEETLRSLSFKSWHSGKVKLARRIEVAGRYQLNQGIKKANMAETDSEDSNNSILSVASAGENLSASLLSFASKWDSGQNYITAIAVVASTIKNLLLDAKSTIEKYGEDRTEENGVHIVCQGIKADFEKIAQALEKANVKAGPGHFVERPSKRFTAVRNSRRLEVVENTDWKEGMVDQIFLSRRPNGVTLLRSELESDPFILGRLEEAKDHLWYLCEGFRYLTLRNLQKE
jgi:hypothetical protein